MRIALVVGHKKSKQGACNREHKICEWEFNNAVAAEVKQRLPEIDIKIIQRDSYRGLPEKINAERPDFVVCMHLNDSDSEAKGCEMLCYINSDTGYNLANLFQKAFVQILKNRDRGVKPKSSEDRGGTVLRYTDAPCIIVEPFFINTEFNDITIENIITCYCEALKELQEVGHTF